MEESRTLTLPLGSVSWDKQLGAYYIDMRPAKIHYSKSYYQTEFDENGVPYFPRPEGKHYSPVNIAQFGFILDTEFRETNSQVTFQQLKACCEKLEEISTITTHGRAWFYHVPDEKYNIKPPFASAMAQGEIMSLFLRFYEHSLDSKWIKFSEEAFEFMLVPVEDGGVCIYGPDEELWLEEFPSVPESKVLNGFVYALLGIVDLYRLTSNQKAKEMLDRCFFTLKRHIRSYDCGYWSYYDLLKRELVRYYYQKNVHVPQMRILHELTKEPVYLELANKWTRTLNKLNFVFVQIMYRILPRWRKVFP